MGKEVTTALVLIATGEKYHRFIRPLVGSADTFFVPHTTFLFTDSPEDYGVTQFPHENLGYPLATLKRYHTFLTQRERLSKFDYVFYIDIDALFVSPVGPEIFGSGITATKHQAYHRGGYDLEENKQSTAYLPSVRQYFCGGFNGGTSVSFLRMAEVIARNVDVDLANGVVAKWHDESHLNKYLEENPPSRVLDHGYCYSEGSAACRAYYPKQWGCAWGNDVTPKILALDK